MKSIVNAPEDQSFSMKGITQKTNKYTLGTFY
jgi:hypothetical protein